MLSKLALAGAASAQAANTDHWAVLVAGSKEFYNYRHQADTCHAYQILKKNGIPEENIIHLAYDDIANYSRNPFPGKIFNKPTAEGTPGVDVYEGCKIDYKGSKASKETLMKVFAGDASAGGPVLKSTENSKIFFYFADHGAPGLVAMASGPTMSAKEMNAAFKKMHDAKMYKEMVVYMEACESGSMFENGLLPDDIKIYATSAANGKESSWGTYCPPDDKVDGKGLNTCLGDLYSVNWMENSDAASMGTETLEQQYKSVQGETKKSHVLEWGDKSFVNEDIGEFQANSPAPEEVDLKGSKWGIFKQFAKAVYKGVVSNPKEVERKNKFAVDSRDIKLTYLYTLVMREPTPENHQALADEIAYRMKVDKTFGEIYPQFMSAVKSGEYPAITEWDCYKQMIEDFEETCFKIDDYAMKYLGSMVHQCQGQNASPELMAQGMLSTKAKMAEVCKTIA